MKNRNRVDVLMLRGMIPCGYARRDSFLPLDNRYHSSAGITQTVSGNRSINLDEPANGDSMYGPNGYYIDR